MQIVTSMSWLVAAEDQTVLGNSPLLDRKVLHGNKLSKMSKHYPLYLTSSKVTSSKVHSGWKGKSATTPEEGIFPRST